MNSQNKIRVRCIECGAERDAAPEEKPQCEDCDMPMIPIKIFIKPKDEGESPL